MGDFMVSRFRDWIRQAKRNLTSALVNAGESLYEEACFEAHQAWERAVKGLLDFMQRTLYLLYDNLVWSRGSRGG